MLIWLNLTAINNALTAIGGTTFTANNYWTSSEYSGLYGWSVGLRDCFVGYGGKYIYGRVRLVLNL